MVDRCVCFEKKFTEMKIIADKHDLKNIKELKKYILFGENCGFCLPYIELMFKTGKTEFEPIYFNGGLSE